MAQRTLPDVIYTAGLDDLSERLIGRANRIEYSELRPQYLPELAALGEALVISPRVAVKASGRAFILPILLDYFQPPALLQLLEDGGLEFVVWTADVGSLGSVVFGMPDPVNAQRDPGSLADRDLTICFPGMDKGLKAQLIDAFIKRTTATDALGAEEAVDVAMQFADRGVFGDRVPGKDAFINATDTRVTNAARQAARDLYATSVVLKNEYDIFETDGTWQAVERIAADIARSAAATVAAESVYAEGSVPSMRTLLLRNVVAPVNLH